MYHNLADSMEKKYHQHMQNVGLEAVPRRLKRGRDNSSASVERN
jgi:hypothetical protein